MGRIKKAVATAILPIFIYQQGNALTFDEVKSDIESRFYVFKPRKVQVEEKNLTAYPLFEKNSVAENEIDFCKSRTFLILENNNIVEDKELYRKASFLANYTEYVPNHGWLGLDNFYRENESEIRKYRQIAFVGYWAGMFFDITDVITEITSDYLKSVAFGKVSISKVDSLPNDIKNRIKTKTIETVKNYIMEKFIYHIKKSITGKIDFESIDSSKMFHNAMYEILWDSAEELERVNKRIRKIESEKRQPTYTEMKHIVNDAISARAGADAAILALANYYGSNDTFRSAMNFLVEHVAKPTIGYEINMFLENIDKIIQIREYLEDVLEPYMPALESFFENLETRTRLWQMLIGDECSNIEAEYITSILRNIKEKIENEKNDNIEKETVSKKEEILAAIDEYLNSGSDKYEQTTQPAKEPLEGKDQSIFDETALQNLQKFNSVQAEIERKNQEASINFGQGVQTISQQPEYEPPKGLQSSDFSVSIQPSRQYLDVSINSFVENLRIPLEVRYSVNKDSCIDISMKIGSDSFGNLTFGEEIFERVFWSESFRHDCVKAGTYRLYPKEPNCPGLSVSECIRRLTEELKANVEYLNRTGRPIKPFTIWVEYNIQARASDQQSSDKEKITIRFYK